MPIVKGAHYESGFCVARFVIRTFAICFTTYVFVHFTCEYVHFGMKTLYLSFFILQ